MSQQCSPDSAERVAELQYEAGMYQSLYENARAEIERLRAQLDMSHISFGEVIKENDRLSAAAQTVTVTDAMCEAAINSDAPECIQGFAYPTGYVIRDVWADKVIWAAPVGGTAKYVAFQKQVTIERMRMMLEAALAVASTERS